MSIQGEQQDEASVTEPSQLRAGVLGALWAVTGLAWIFGGYLADTLRAPAPPYYSFVMTLASVALVVSTIVTMFHVSRITYRAALARMSGEIAAMREQQAQRDAAWSTMNALLGGTDTNLRVLPRASERNLVPPVHG